MTYEEIIHNPDYVEIESIEHSDIKNLVINEIVNNQGSARIGNMYQIVGVLAFVLGGFKAFMPFYLNRETGFLVWLGIGLAFTFTILIALHELIHATAYKFVGAHHLSFGMEWRKFLFYVQADREVLNYKQFKTVAMAPAVIVGILSVLGMAIFYNQPAFYFFLPVFSFHSFFCSGDFGLLCFFENRPDMDVLTFDLKAEGKAYFYGKKKII